MNSTLVKHKTRTKKRKICVNHYLTIDDLRVKSDTELDMKRKELFNMGKYELEEGELLIE